MSGRIITALTAILLCCGCYDSFKPPQNDYPARQTDATIAELQNMWPGKTMIVTENIVIGGNVTSSDRAGNFYRTFTICDGTGGVEILAGAYSLESVYPIGCFVNVRLQGCAIDSNYGILRIGLPSYGGENSEPEPFESAVLLDRYIIRDGTVEKPQIPLMTLPQLSQSLCGCPVTIQNLHSTETPASWNGYRHFSDNDGNDIYTYTREYADFAEDAIPETQVTITGILMYGYISREDGNGFIIKMRNREDCSTPNG